MEEVKVMGHVPADTDSVCSPIVYAWYLSKFKNINAKAYISGKINKETDFVLNYFNVPLPLTIDSLKSGEKLILVDTNNPDELVLGHNNAEIIEIVDHHKLAGLTTANPATITIRPYACSATVIWDLMEESEQNQIPKDIAGLMLAAIISDTLNFTSPTTTDLERPIAEILALKANVNINDFASEMFKAKSDISDFADKDILLTDHKDFEFSNGKYKVSVFETTNPSVVLDRISGIKNEMEIVKNEANLKGVFFFVVDILKTESTLVLLSNVESEIAKIAFNVNENNGLMHLPGVASRKKQMVPNLENAIKSIL